MSWWVSRLARLDNGIPSVEPLSPLALDLLDQDNGVPRNQAEQRKCPEDCDETERLPDE